MKNNKNILKYGLLVSLASVAVVSCQSFLDQEPQSQITEAIYFTEPQHFEYASNKFYDAFDFSKYTTDESSDLCANFGADEPVGRGLVTIPSNDSQDGKVWVNCYSRLRNINILLTAAEKYSDKEEIAEYVGSASFFRAYEHFTLLQKYGGVPIADAVFDPSSAVVNGPRSSRYEVVSQILADLDVAIENLLDNSKVSSVGKVSKQAAQAFKARVCLYEATWDKYVGTSTDGDASYSGAGSAKPADYPSVEAMLTEAKTLSQAVMESGEFELWDHSDDPVWGKHHLRYLFMLEDALSNPFGLTKKDNKEYILQSIYDYQYRTPNLNLSHSSVAPASRKLMDMYLCTDGLPVQYSKEFQGYEDIIDEYENRDYRLTSLQAIPGVKYWDNNKVAGRENSLVGGFDVDQADMPNSLVYVPQFTAPYASKRNIGYKGLKWVSEHPQRDDRKEAPNYPLIRLAEVYLIYAEATCELGNGSISNSDLDKSINLIRKRSGVANLSNELIAPYSDLTMLGEIRRERALELFGEGFRYDDIKRWGIAVEELAHPVLSVYAYVNGVKSEYINLSNGVGDGFEDLGGVQCVDLSEEDIKSYPDGGVTTEELSISSYAGFAKVQPGALIIDSKSVRLFSKKNYLNPIPQHQIDLNPKLLQNPDWI